MNQEVITHISEVVSGIIGAMGVRARVEVEDVPHKGIVYNIMPETDAYMLIGHRGEHVYALEVLVQSIVRKHIPDVPRFSVDVDDYRRKREWYLKETAQGAVAHLKRTGRPVGLVPMPNYERRFVHAYVQEMHPDVLSESVGDGFRRRIVLRSK